MTAGKAISSLTDKEAIESRPRTLEEQLRMVYKRNTDQLRSTDGDCQAPAPQYEQASEDHDRQADEKSRRSEIRDGQEGIRDPLCGLRGGIEPLGYPLIEIADYAELRPRDRDKRERRQGQPAGHQASADAQWHAFVLGIDLGR
jgi:hypothetical protein